MTHSIEVLEWLRPKSWSRSHYLEVSLYSLVVGFIQARRAHAFCN
jgi:hypothetical protein